MPRKRLAPLDRDHKPDVAPADDIQIAKLKALEWMADGMSDSEVARQLGMTQPVVWRWRTHDPRFVAALSEVRRVGLERASCLLDRNATGAVEVAVVLMRDGDVPPAVRLKACEIVLDRSGLYAKWRTIDTSQKADAQDIRDALREIARQHPALLAEVVAEVREEGK